MGAEGDGEGDAVAEKPAEHAANGNGSGHTIPEEPIACTAEPPVASEAGADRAGNGAEESAEPPAGDGADAADSTGDAPADSAAAATGECGAVPAVKSDLSLSERLKGKGLSLETEAAAASAGPTHRHISVSSTEQAQLFTPLAAQGADAVKAEQRRRQQSEEEMLNTVKKTLRKWVQECLASDDKKARFLEKGSLQCRLHARWSDGFHQKLKDLVARYKGKLIADSDKDKEAVPKAPAWAVAAELHNEKWWVAFDAASFEIFMRLHPEVVEPPSDEIREYIREFIEKADLGALKIKDLMDALRLRFGTLRRSLTDRAKRVAGEYITQKQEDEAKKKKPSGAPAKKPKLDRRVRFESAEDVAWAESVLVPFGLRANGEAVVKAPAPVALPILEGLKTLEERPDFRDLMKQTSIGKVVNAFRHHADEDVVAKSKEVVAMWKASLKQPRKKPPGDGSQRPSKKQATDAAAASTAPTAVPGDGVGPANSNEATVASTEDGVGSAAAKEATVTPTEGGAGSADSKEANGAPTENGAGSADSREANGAPTEHGAGSADCTEAAAAPAEKGLEPFDSKEAIVASREDKQGDVDMPAAAEAA